MNENLAHIKAVGKYSAIINYMYRQAKKLMSKDVQSNKHVNCGDKWE